MEPIKPGYKSTEFYVTAAVIGLAAAFGLPADAKWQVRLGAFFGAVATAIAYKWARTSQKNTAAELAHGQADVPADAVGAVIEGEEVPPKVVGLQPRGFARLRTLGWVAFVGVFLSVLGAACAFGSREGRAQLGRDLVACGIAVGLAEFKAAVDGAGKVLEDGRIDDGEVGDALSRLPAAAQPALLSCAVALIHDAIHVPAEPPPPEGMTAVAALKIKYEAPKARAKRRAAAYLASKGTS